MTILGGLEKRDRKLLLASGVLVTGLIVLLAVFSPAANDNDPTPSSYASTNHGAKAAYLLLEQSGYKVERWEQPLALLAEQADEHTTLVIAQPYFRNVHDARAPVRKILDRGGRVLVTGIAGGYLVPVNHVEPSSAQLEKECKATPTGFSELAASGEVRLRPEAHWSQISPLQRDAYLCNGQAVVVFYSIGKGTVIWWANSLPLENSGIERAGNLALLLASVGPVTNTRVVWDESLHGDVPSLWSYTAGTPIHLVWWQLGFVAVLLVLSYSRRSGPVRPDPVVTRAAPIEFVESLGELYRKADATNTAVLVAYQRFRHLSETSFGIPHASLAPVPVLAVALATRLGSEAGKPGATRLEQNLVACENAAQGDRIPVKNALYLVQVLRDYEDLLRAKLNSVTKDDRLG